MKALLAKIPRDRSLLLLLAPPLVLLAFLAASRSQEHYSALPVGATVPTTTTSTTAPPDAEVALGATSAQVESSTASRSGTTTGASSGSGSSGSSGSGSSGASNNQTVAPNSVPAWVGGDDATTTTEPGPPTTAVPDERGPDPAVNEVPVAILMPVSAVLVVGLGFYVVSRRRRAEAGAPESPNPPTPSA